MDRELPSHLAGEVPKGVLIVSHISNDILPARISSSEYHLLSEWVMGTHLEQTEEVEMPEIEKLTLSVPEAAEALGYGVLE